jgi:hypothetical protein
VKRSYAKLAFPILTMIPRLPSAALSRLAICLRENHFIISTVLFTTICRHASLGKYNKSKFTSIMVPRELAAELKALKVSHLESVADVIRRLLQAAAVKLGRKERQPEWVLVDKSDREPDDKDIDIWRSELFA